MINTNISGCCELYRLSDFEEGVGPFLELAEEDGILVARLGEVFLALPPELENSLRPLVGQKIAILKTSLPGKNFLFRVLKQGPIVCKTTG
jgi:hypothetical protein